MLLTRDEMTYDFRGAKLEIVRDREMLGWAFNQFLYGEVTGIQVGHWLYNAPNLGAARFLAQQSIEELQHVDNFLKCLAIIGEEPAAPHRLVRFLSTGMMPDTWAEHVSNEMAMGEGLVLMCFYALIDTIDNEEIVRILSRAVKQEERHVEFGEQETARLIAGNDALRRRLLGLNLVSLWATKRIAKYMQKTMDPAHPVMSQLGGFLDTVVKSSELRLLRIGLLDRPLAELSRRRQLRLIAEAHAAGLVRSAMAVPRRLAGRNPRKLTDTYLDDPSLRQALMKARAKAQAA